MSVTRFRLSIGALIQVYFKGMVAQFGWGFFGFGMIFALIFANVNTVMGIFMSPEWQRTKGQVTFVEETGASEGDEMVIKQHFSFIGPDGISYDNHSYSTGHYIEEGQQVTVEYDSTNPEIARIEGMRRELFGSGAAFVLIFPLIGLMVILGSLKSRYKLHQRLKNGNRTSNYVSLNIFIDTNEERISSLDRKALLHLFTPAFAIFMFYLWLTP
jgi:hypothetical protein